MVKRSWPWIVLLLLMAVCLLWLGFLPNLGLPFGYWGEHNRTVSGLRNLKNVMITGTRINLDITLEEFSVDMKVDGIEKVSLYFPEAAIPRDRLWKEASYLRLQCNGLNPSGDGKEGVWYWLFDLSPDNQLELGAGMTIRSLGDVLENLRRVLRVVASAPSVSCDDMAKVNWPPGDNLNLYVPCSAIVP